MLRSRIIGPVTGRLVLSLAFCAGPSFAACATSWSNGYGYCRMITLDYTQVAAPLANFTVAVTLSLNPAHVLNANCYDCIFTSDNAGTARLNWETESYSSGTLVAHVLMTSLSNTAATTFYLFYGNASISSFQGGAAGSAWDTNYVAVQHLSGLPSSAIDSISGLSGTIANVTAASGVIGGAGSFNGTSASIDILPASATTDRFSGDFTLSAWFNSASSSYQVILGKESTSYAYEWIFAINAHAAGTMELWDLVSLNYAFVPYTGSAWQYGVCARTSGTLNCYVNGTVGTSASSSTNFASQPSYNDLLIGQRQYTGAQQWFSGTIDEVRLSKVARSTSWITTEYNNQKPGSTFVTLGPEASLVVTKVRHRVTAN